MSVRDDFPLLHIKVRSKPLVYLDNAATTQKPSVVIEAMNEYYRSKNANVHRGVYRLSEEATKGFENTRDKIKEFIHARSRAEIIFTRGTTESINLASQILARGGLVKKGDEILLTEMEHHSNIVPWQIAAEQVGASIKVAPVTDSGELDLDELFSLMTENVKVLALTYASNTLGTINPIRQIVKMARSKNILTLVDGAQAVQHEPINVQDLDCDFFAFSSHKMYGPTGVGVLYGKEELLKSLPPYQGGGDMIRTVSFKKTTYNDLPYKFEAGTPAIAEVVGLGAAVDYIQKTGFDFIQKQEMQLLQIMQARLSEFPEVRIIGEAKHKTAVVSFVLKDIHPHDVATLLDGEGVAVRAGHHCTQPLMERFGVPATTRASLAFYNTEEEVLKLATGIKKVLEIFK